MKHTTITGNKVAGYSLAIALCAIVSTSARGSDSSNPSIPVGSLDTFPSVVHAGTHPTLNWNITYPEKVTDVVDIDDDGTITPKQDLHMDIRVLGASVQTSATNWLTVEAYQKSDGASGFSRFFRGKQPQVDPTRIYYTNYVSEGRTIDVGGRCYYSGWYPFYKTGVETHNVKVLANGDIPPETVPAYNQDDIEAFLRPYLEDGKISIGPKDVIVLIELAMTHPSQSAFDLQDLVLLITFRKS